MHSALSWSQALRYMVRVLKGSDSFTCTPRVHPITEWTIPAFSFTAKAGTHLPLTRTVSIPESETNNVCYARLLNLQIRSVTSVFDTFSCHACCVWQFLTKTLWYGFCILWAHNAEQQRCLRVNFLWPDRTCQISDPSRWSQAKYRHNSTRPDQTRPTNNINILHVVKFIAY